MPKDHKCLATFGESLSKLYKRRTKECRLVYRFTVAILIIPAFLAAIGAIVERAVYGTLYRPNFSPVLMLYGGFITAPFILVRWFWPAKMKKHIEKLEFLYYILFSAGFVVAVVTTTVAGNELFYMGKHVRSLFGGPNSEEFLTIISRDDVYIWLEKTFRRVYDQQAEVNFVGARQLPGRLLLLGPIRLNQYRSVGKKCSKGLINFGIVPLEHCYTSTDQDYSTFSNLSINYQNPSYKIFVGNKIFASDISLKGTLESYPLAGHWVLFHQNLNWTIVKEMLDALETNKWIDDQTRMISLDCAVVAPDFSQLPIVSTIHLIEVTKSGLLVPVAPQVNFNYLDEADDDEEDMANRNMDNGMNGTSGGAGGGGIASDECRRVMKHPRFFIPVYLGILPALVYTLFMHSLQLLSDWRKYTHNLFTYSELAWFITVMLSIAFRWKAIYYSPCTFSLINQTLYPGNQSSEVKLYEFLQISQEWFESRRVLGLALFLHLFNVLKFIVQIPALSQLIQTLKVALSELASFSLSFLVVFFAFVFMFYIIFSVESKDYQNVPRCIATLWLGMLGELSITPELWRVKEWSIPMVILFIFVSAFVLLTVIVAIISDAHERSRIKREREEERRRQLAKSVLSKWRKGLFRIYRNSKQEESSAGHVLSVFSSAKDAQKHDVGFSSVVGMAVPAKRTLLESNSAGPPSPLHSIRQRNVNSSPLPNMRETSDSPPGGTPDSWGPSSVTHAATSVVVNNSRGEEQSALSKLTARSAARFLTAGQDHRRERTASGKSEGEIKKGSHSSEMKGRSTTAAEEDPPTLSLEKTQPSDLQKKTSAPMATSADDCMRQEIPILDGNCDDVPLTVAELVLTSV